MASGSSHLRQHGLLTNPGVAASPALSTADLTASSTGVGGTNLVTSSGHAAAQIGAVGTPPTVHPALAAVAAASHPNASPTNSATGHGSTGVNLNLPTPNLNLPGGQNEQHTASNAATGGNFVSHQNAGGPPSGAGQSSHSAAITTPSSTNTGFSPMTQPDPSLNARHRTQLASLSLMSHMSKSLLQNGGICSDVTIAAFGRLYRLHRLLLVQAGFFNTMFCGGFSEAEDLPGEIKLNRNENQGNRFDVHFPDPNMSRSAFEFCIATLYGCAPTLKLPGWANPKAEAPLGEGFVNIGSLVNYAANKGGPSAGSNSTNQKHTGTGLGEALERFDSKDGKRRGKKGKSTQGSRNFETLDVSFSGLPSTLDASGSTGGSGSKSPSEPNSQWATPRFLLSLIATSTYLGIPSVTSQALTLILGSITPYTVSTYLRFASGLGIVNPSVLHLDEGEPPLPLDELEGPLVGWERLSTANPTESPSAVSVQSADQGTATRTPKASDVDGGDASGNSDLTQSPARKSSPAPQIPADLLSSDRTSSSIRTADEFPLGENSQVFYGPSCNKIGEACVCWLSRWGGDVLDWEISLRGEEGGWKTDEGELLLNPTKTGKGPGTKDDGSDFDRSDDSSEDLSHGVKPASKGSDEPTQPAPPRPVVWAYSRAHGLPSDVVREVISSDSFFVRSEWTRYTLAREVVELRRREKDSIADRNDSNSNGADDDDMAAYDDDESSVTAGMLGQGIRRDASSTRSKATGDAFHGVSGRSAQADSSFLSRSADTTDRIHMGGSSELDSDEVEYNELFARGIYYTHMSFAELSMIANDVSPSTGQLYVPEQVLQRALWSGMEFRNTIVTSDSREIDPAKLGDKPDELLPTGLTAKEDALCDLHLASDLDAFRQDFFAGTSVPSSSFADSSFKGRRGFSRENTPSVPGSPAQRLGRKSSNLNMGADLLSGGLSKKSIANKRFFPVPADDTLRLGDGLGSLVAPASHTRESMMALSLEQVGNSTDPAAAAIGASGLAAVRDPYTLSMPSARRTQSFPTRPLDEDKKPLQDYFGIADYSRTGLQLAERSSAVSVTANESTMHETLPPPKFSVDDHVQSGGDSKNDGVTDDRPEEQPSIQKEMWLPYEPMRIGVDFWGVDKLAERNRLYSPTFFYGGSLWNLYVQTIRKAKGVQLGIYLHRQNPAEALPPASAAPSEAAGSASSTRVNAPSLDQLLSESLNLAPAGLHTDTVGGTLRPPRGAPYGSSLSGPGDEQPPTVPPVMPAMPYRDPRKGIRAFFSIHCPSPFGNALTRFSSGPDQFTLSQSWGWKSSSLLGTVYFADGHLEDVRSESANRFRCVCTIGLV